MTTSDKTKLVIEREFSHPRSAVFAAFSDAESMKSWMYPMDDGGHSEVELDFRVGGKYTLDMHSKKNVYEHTGEYLEIVPDEKLVFTWCGHHFGDTVCTVELVDVPGGTKMTFTHDLLPADLEGDVEGGWGSIFAKLDASLG